MSNNLELIEYLVNIGLFHRAEEDQLKLKEIKDMLLELARLKRELKDIDFDIKQIGNCMVMLKGLIEDVKIIIDKHLV